MHIYICTKNAGPHMNQLTKTIITLGLLLAGAVYSYGCKETKSSRAPAAQDKPDEEKPTNKDDDTPSNEDESPDDRIKAPDRSAKPEPTECIKKITQQSQKPILCRGINFNLTVSKKCAGGGCGVIVDVHGWTMNAFLQEQNTGLAKLGKEKGYVVIQPTAPLASWNMSHYPVVHDFLKQAIKAFAIDRDKVHFTGFSQGSMMTWYFLCNHGDMLASAAPIAYAGGLCYGKGKENPAIPILYHHGESDGFSSFNNAKATRQNIIDGLDMKLVDQKETNDFERSKYTNEKGVVLETIFHKYTTYPTHGIGHCFPNPPIKTPYGCTKEATYSWGKEVMRFFESHSRRKL